MTYHHALKATLLLSTILGTSTIAFTEDDDVEEVVVTASRRPQPIHDVAKSISVISEEVLIERQYSYLLDALQSLPGVALNQNGSFGGVATISIRGASSDQTVVLIDGVQVNDTSSVGGAFNFANLDTAGIARVEVLRGPQAVLYGSDAIGGVINIITKEPTNGLAGDAFAEYGAFDSIRAGGSLRGGTEALGYNLSANYTDTDGISAADEADGNIEPDGLQTFAVRGKVKAKLSEVSSFEIISNYVESETEFDDFGPTDGDSTGASEEFSIAGRGFFSALNGQLDSTLSAEYSVITRENFSGGTPTFNAKGERFNLDILSTLALSDGLTLTAGAQHEAIKAETVDPETITINSLFGLLSYSAIEGFTVSGGLRVDDHETFGATTNGEINASYIIASSDTQLTASWGEGFKAPTIFQLTFFCCGFDANPNLNPERSNAWQVGIRQPLADGKVTLSATYFDQDTDDLIIFTFTDGYQNIAQTNAKGVEVGFEAALTVTLTMTANYTYTAAKDLTTGTRLVNRPRDMAFASVSWQASEKLRTNISITHNGRELDSSGIFNDRWTRFDLRASYSINESVEFYGRIDNLFDTQYQQVIGFGTPGISAYAGIRTRF